MSEMELSIDFSDAHERCWRCGYKKKALERCHIIPHSLGGKDTPSNFVLLCQRCHIDNPNVSDPEIMWDWLRAYKVPWYDTFWAIEGMNEYNRIYGISFYDEMKKREIPEDKFHMILKQCFVEAGVHFGHPHFNLATLAGILRIFIKELDKTALDTSI